jgi:hypothetical protein
MASCEALSNYTKVLDVIETDPIHQAFLLMLIVVIGMKQAICNSATRLEFRTNSQFQEIYFLDLSLYQLNLQALSNVLFPKFSSVYWHV